MGNCATREFVAVAPPTTSALLQLPPQLNNLSKQISFGSPQAGKRTAGGSLTKDFFILEELPTDVSDRPISISPTLFLSMIQRKSRKPIDYVLIDLQPRLDHNRHTIKFSICLWENNAVADCANPKTRQDILTNIKNKCANRTLLLFDNTENPPESKNVLLFYDLLSNIQISWTAAYLLRVPMKNFCKSYPHCYSKSPLSLPGPTEILWSENPGFCLYLGDIKTLKFNEAVLKDVHDIRTVINLAGEQGSSSQNPNCSIQIMNIPQTDCPNRGVWYAKAVEQLLDVADRGFPTMVMDATGDKHAPKICAFLLVSLGWEPSAAMNHIFIRRGRPRSDDDILFDQETIRALNKVAKNDKEGAIREYSEWKDESLPVEKR